MPSLSRLIAPLTILILLGLTACSPIGPIPAGQLSGDVQPIPSDWSASDDIQIVQIETRPDNPYSINIWGVGEGRNFYIGAGGGEDVAWVRHLADDAQIRLRLGSSLFLLTAVRVTDVAEQTRVGKLYAAKYDEFDAEASTPGEAVMFRLDPR